MYRYTFPKEEKLKSSKKIAFLFKEGRNVFSYPLKFIYTFSEIPDAALPKMAVSVSGKIFKKATDRNLIKRRLRESYRLHKGELSEKLTASDMQLEGMFIFVGKEILSYEEISKGMRGILAKLKKQENL